MTKQKRPFSWFAIPLLFLLEISYAQPQQQPSFTLEQVLSSPFPSNLVGAESAGRIAWVFSYKAHFPP